MDMTRQGLTIERDDESKVQLDCEGQEGLHDGSLRGSLEILPEPTNRCCLTCCNQSQRDGRIEVLSAGTDLGTGTYTILAQTTAEVLDVPTRSVKVSLGDTDLRASALGGKAVGELGIVGVAAAIGNAVYHATGKRIRDLPFTMDKLLT
jgi:CO/xanthine dehydrogenase Mo-binding subunit